MILSFFTFYQNWIMPSFKHLFLLSMIGILGGLANLWLSQSYKLSEVSLVSPLKYLALIFAIIFGYLIWDEVPTSKTLIGALLVVFSSFIIFKREMTLKKRVSVARHE
jgi:drug/metabolite transporter (DMT)-like permease